ncbi:streptomycin biosynthesis protein [Streptomyces sp. NPDC093510]|uniref:streptomycin biosynthesis protein n=1 Tax=Streptomyces sp. NPDC093510 TaxID=3155199 RepID=UPI00342773FB
MSTAPDPTRDDARADHFLALRQRVSDDCVSLPIASLLPADSPRLDGESPHHVRLMAELDDEMQPIVVHEGSLRVVDGMHRLRARAARGDATIRARYFHGTDDEAFLFAVQANTRHGLPLTREERRAAARRIIEAFPAMSDRALSKLTGLAQQTVTKIRQQSPSACAGQKRIGVDGRARPINPDEHRRIAEQYLKENPHASLREIARAANISPSTAHDVRRRAAPRDDARESPAQRPAPAHRDGPGPLRTLELLARDPSVRHTEAGRLLVQWLRLTAAINQNHKLIVSSIPEHCTEIAAQAMRVCMSNLDEFARRLEQQ